MSYLYVFGGYLWYYGQRDAAMNIPETGQLGNLSERDKAMAGIVEPVSSVTISDEKKIPFREAQFSAIYGLEAGGFGSKLKISTWIRFYRKSRGTQGEISYGCRAFDYSGLLALCCQSSCVPIVDAL